MRLVNENRQKFLILRLIIVILTLFVALSFASSPVLAQKEANQKVVLVLDWTPNIFQHFIFTPLGLGFYEEEGIDLEWISPTDEYTSIRLVATGKANLGIAMNDVPIIGIVNEQMPVKVISTISPHMSLGFITIKKDVPKLSDLKGKTIGVNDTPFWRAAVFNLLKEVGLDKDDVDIVDPGFTVLSPLLAGKLALSCGNFPFEYLGAEYGTPESISDVRFTPIAPDYGPISNFNLFVNTKWAEENSDTVKRFLDATLRGMKYSLDHPGEAVDIFRKDYPTYSREDELSRFLLSAEQFVTSYTNDKGLGWNDPEEWQALIDFCYDAGALDRRVEASEIITNEYMPKIKYVPEVVILTSTWGENIWLPKR